MKKVILILFVLLCIMLFAVPSFAMKNEPKEFRGIPWGASPPKNSVFGVNLWGLTELGRLGEITIYSRAEEAVVGGIKPSAPITYHYQDGIGFVGALAKFEGYENFRLMHKACVEHWGEPDSEGKQENDKERGSDIFIAFWIGEEITVSTEYHFNTTEDGFLIIGRGDYLMTLIKMSAESK